MSISSTIRQRRRTRKVTGVLLIAMFLVAYWPVGPVIEAALSPFAFTIWVIVVIPALLIAIYSFNAYRNISADESMENESDGER